MTDNPVAEIIARAIEREYCDTIAGAPLAHAIIAALEGAGYYVVRVRPFAENMGTTITFE